MSTGKCAGGSEIRSAAPAIQGGGQADQRNRLSLLHMRAFIIANQIGFGHVLVTFFSILPLRRQVAFW